MPTFFICLTIFIPSKETPTLTIGRARSHEDMSGTYTPLDVSLSTEDKGTKVKPVDLICVVDKSGSMEGAPFELVLESLRYLINLMDETDNFALITFSSYAQLVNGLTKMTSENKKIILNSLSTLSAYGMTNIYDGLKTALDLLTNDYSSGDRVASIILLSDGYDNYNDGQVVNNFKTYMRNTKKDDYVFTMYAFGYGTDFDYELLNQIALIKDGAYFDIDQLSDVGDAFLKIYGSLSTVVNVNVQLKIQSKFRIISIYGIEDMHDANITNGTISSFYVKLIQVVYGKKYDFVLLVDVPRTTPLFTEVLNATVSRLDLFENFLWDGKFSPSAYEEYIRCIVVDFFEEGYKKQSMGEIDNGIKWIKNNYNGTKNWVKELDGVKADLITGEVGKANLLSKISELKTSRIGTHYDEGNSYQRELISNSHNLNISKLEKIEIKGQKLIDCTSPNNYYYFYLNEGKGKINDITFSGKSSSFIIYSNDSFGHINITADDSMKLYFDQKTIQRLQTVVDFDHVGKFIIKKDVPFDFYTRVDGKRDITFNIEFQNLNINLSDESNIYNLLELNAYILSDNDIDNLVNNENTLNTFKKFRGEFNKKLGIGKVVLKQRDISDNLNSIYNNYLYIIINKVSGITSNMINQVQGQFFFIPNNYIYSSVPVKCNVFSHIEQGDNSAHMYTLEINSTSLKDSFMIEFEPIDNNELDIKILNYQDVVDDKIDLYNDYDGYEIDKKKISNKIYMTVMKKDHNEIIDNKIILSIFSSEVDHIPSSNLSYVFKYYSVYQEFSSNLISTDFTVESSNINEITNGLMDTTNELKDITNEMKDATNEINYTINELFETTNEIKDTTNELMDTINEIEETTIKIKETTNKIEETTNEIEETINEIEETTNKIEETTNKIKETTNEIEETTNEIKETTNEIEETSQIGKNRISVILLGFARYSYSSFGRMINFLIYFAYIEKNVYAKKITIILFINYKRFSRYLQAYSETQGECTLIEDDSLYQKKYKCSIETNGKEIDNIKFDRNIYVNDNDIDFSNIEISPIGIKYLHNIQDVGKQDLFDNKMLYILAQAELIINNNKNQLIINGYMNENSFTYNNFNLEIVFNYLFVEFITNISCNATMHNNKYNFECGTKDKIEGILNSAYSNLGNANLIVCIPQENNKYINFKEIRTNNNRNNTEKKSKLSKGQIAVFIIFCVIGLIALIALIIHCCKKRYNKKEDEETGTTMMSFPSSSYTN